MARERNEEALVELNLKFKKREEEIEKRRVVFEEQKKMHA